MRDRRRGGWQSPPGADDNANWRLLWAIIGATIFTAVMFFLDLI